VRDDFKLWVSSPDDILKDRRDRVNQCANWLSDQIRRLLAFHAVKHLTDLEVKFDDVELAPPGAPGGRPCDNYAWWVVEAAFPLVASALEEAGWTHRWNVDSGKQLTISLKDDNYYVSGHLRPRSKEPYR